MAEGITRRGDSWRARYRNPETGKQHERSFPRQVDAVRWRRQQLDALDRGRWVDPRAGGTTFGSYFEAWSQDQVWAENTRRNMAQVATVPFADVPLSKIRASHVEAWVKSMTVPTIERAKPLAPGTIKTRFINVRTVFRAAVRDGFLTTNPTENIRLPRQRRRDAAMQVPEPQAVRQALDHADERFRALVAVCAFAGLRVGEAAALQLDDVDFLRRTLHVRRQVQPAGGARVTVTLPKYGSERSVPIPDQLVAMLAAHVELGLVNEWLFAGAEDNPPHQNSVSWRWRSTLKRAGLSGIRMHDLRHFYASGLIAAGCDVVTLQRNLGHSSSATTLQTYSHLWPTAEDKSRAAAATVAAEVLGELGAAAEGTVRAGRGH